MPHRISLVAVAVWMLFVVGCTQRADNHRLAIGFYNCENFFDYTDNPLKDDEEFTPGGKFHYTRKIYESKLRNIATVIRSMDQGKGPVLLGLAEVENSRVLTDLINQPEIAAYHLRFEWFEGPDPRGINVALLYNPKYFRSLNANALRVDLRGCAGKSDTRDVLQVHGILIGDTVDIFVNHWPSRVVGVEESKQKRSIAAKVNRDAVLAITGKNAEAKIIVMGDFNDNPEDSSIKYTLAATDDAGTTHSCDLYNPWSRMHKKGVGTEVFRHTWNMFDQIIISKSLISNKNHKVHYDGAEIYKPDFLIDRYKGHEGEPHRSFAGTKWINGYSDHFPILVYLSE